jgi:hypothetical protein
MARYGITQTLEIASMNGDTREGSTAIPRLLSNLELALGLVLIIVGAIDLVGYLRPSVRVPGTIEDGAFWLFVGAVTLLPFWIVEWIARRRGRRAA